MKEILKTIVLSRGLYTMGADSWSKPVPPQFHLVPCCLASKEESFMDYNAFCHLFTSALPVGTVLRNPGGGVTEIINYTANGRLVYRRGRSRMYVSLRDLYAAWQQFQGQRVSSADLRAFAPEVFNSKAGGHSCNCTVLFLAFRKMGLVDRIAGAGRRGDPYCVDLRQEAAHR